MATKRRAFVVQLDPQRTGATQPALHGWVEELDSGLSAHFDSAAALVAFLERALQTSRLGAEDENG